MIALPQRIQLDGMPAIMAKLDYAAGSGTLDLDLRDVEAVEAHAGPLLSALLLSTYEDLEADVRPPASGELLARTGIAFALANRLAKTRILGEEASVRWPQWRESWVPGSRETVDALFSPQDIDESRDEPNLIGARYAAFVNPHLSSPSSEQHEVVNLLHPWLREFMPKRLLHDQFLDEVGHIITELVENVRQHAPRTVTGKAAKSLVHVWRTQGVDDRFYVTVMDNGPGVLATARDKVIDGDRLSDSELLRGLLLGKLPRYNPARGFGLPEVWKFADANGARLWMSASDQLVAFERSDRKVSKVAVAVGGTAVTLGFKLEG